MSIVNRSTLTRIKEQRNSAVSTDTWEAGYNRAIRALDAAIAQIEQIDHVTTNFSVELRKD